MLCIFIVLYWSQESKECLLLQDGYTWDLLKAFCILKEMIGLAWWSRGKDSGLSVQGARV